MPRKRTLLVRARKSAGLTQEELAFRLGVDRSTVGRWEVGETEPLPWLRPKLANALRISNGELSALLDGASSGEPWRHTREARATDADVATQLDIDDFSQLRIGNSDWTRASSQELSRLLSKRDELPITDAAVTRLVHEWLITAPPQVVELRAGRRIGEGLVSKVERRVSELRHMDDFVAGGDLRHPVENELQATAALMRDASYPEPLGRRLLVAVGELCQLAGWVLGDAGQYVIAMHYYGVGLKAAHAADDVALAANLISSLAYQQSNVGSPRDAILLAQSADTGMKQHTTPAVHALIKERLAWAHAKAGERRQTERMLAAVEAVYERRDPADEPVWMYWLDEDEINIMAGRCYVELGRADRAVPLLSAVLDHYDERRTREVALYTSWLAEAHLMLGAVEEGVAAATRTLELTSQITSARSAERVNLLRAKLHAYESVPVVADFEAHARELANR